MKECRLINVLLKYGESMKAFRILSLAATLALPTSLVAETKSSKLNPGPSKTMTPAKVNEKKHPVSSSVDAHDAVEALSPKNKKVFSTLSPDDQKRVDDAYKRGRDPQAKMMDILKHDHKSNMKKSKKSKSKSKKEEAQPLVRGPEVIYSAVLRILTGSVSRVA